MCIRDSVCEVRTSTRCLRVSGWNPGHSWPGGCQRCSVSGLRAVAGVGRAYSVVVDLDAFVAAHQGEWSRLEYLASHGSPSGAEADDILDLYQRVATHLSLVRSSAPDPSLVTYLSSLLARARTRSVGTRAVAWADLGGFFTETFPAALYRTRRWWIITAVVNVAVALALGWWFLSPPRS